MTNKRYQIFRRTTVIVNLTALLCGIIMYTRFITWENFQNKLNNFSVLRIIICMSLFILFIIIVVNMSIPSHGVLQEDNSTPIGEYIHTKF